MPARPRTAIAGARRAAIAATALAALVFAGAFFAPGVRAAPFEWEGVAATGVDAGAIATDGAGRVYVPIRNGGRVLVLDSARNGNRPIGTVTGGNLTDPSAVAVDNRSNIYVADAARDEIAMFLPIFSGATYRGTDSARGSGLGQISGPVALATDVEPRLYVAERGNMRVQAFDPGRGTLDELFAFGVADPLPWGAPAGMAIDAQNRFYVSSDDASSGVRMFDSRGVFVTTAVAAGSDPGQVKGAAGVAVDPAARLIVADTGNDRVSLFGSATVGFTPLGEFGAAGSGDGQFDAPASVAVAPGAIVYVLDSGNRRIVRLRYDDADHDGAIDALDTCRELANVEQTDRDADGAGDACDGDDDGDGIADAQDPCPQTNAILDLDRNGCADPMTSSIRPKSRSRFASHRGPAHISGRAQADVVGVARVLVAVRRRHGRACAWWSGRRERFVTGACNAVRWTRARGTKRWRLPVARRAFASGGYAIYTRAVQRITGAVERSNGARAEFTVR